MKSLNIILGFLIVFVSCEIKTLSYLLQSEDQSTEASVNPVKITSDTTFSSIDDFETTSTQIYEATTEIPETTTKLDTCASLTQEILIIQAELKILEEEFNETSTKIKDEIKLLDKNLTEVLKATEESEYFEREQNYKIEREFENFKNIYKKWFSLQQHIMLYEGGMYGHRFDYSIIKECHQSYIENFDTIVYNECLAKFPAIVQNITEQEVEMLEDFYKLQSKQKDLMIKWKEFLEFDDAQKTLSLENRDKIKVELVKKSELEVKIKEKKSLLKELKKPFDALTKKLYRKLNGKIQAKFERCLKILWVPLTGSRFNEVVGGHDSDGVKLHVIRYAKADGNFLYGKMKLINRREMEFYVTDNTKEIKLSSSERVDTLTASFYRWCKVAPTDTMRLPVCRANHHGSITPGTLISNSNCRIGYGFKTIDYYSPNFEILKETECH